MLKRVAILIATYNRSSATLACLASIAKQKSNFLIDIFMVDGGSPDDTLGQVQIKYPNVKCEILQDAYWNEAMRKAWTSATDFDYDFYLWLNNDVILLDGALEELLNVHNSNGDLNIVVGRTIDPTSGIPTYGALKRKKTISKLNFSLLGKNEVFGDTMNGNIVLVSQSVVNKIGILSSRFQHSMGDIEYGLRARKFGINILSTPTAIGFCSRNDDWVEAQNELTIRSWRYILKHPKGIRPKEWLYMCSQYGGILWPLNFIYRYLKIIRLKT